MKNSPLPIENFRRYLNSQSFDGISAKRRITPFYFAAHEAGMVENDLQL